MQPAPRKAVVLAALAAAGGLRVLDERKAAADPSGEAENTYGLPEGTPLRRLLVRAFRLQERNLRPHLGQLARAVDDPQPLPPLDPGAPAIARPAVPILRSLQDEGGRGAEAELDLEDVWDVKDPNVRSAIEGAAFAFADSTNRTTTLALEDAREKLRRELAEGLYERGETLAELTERTRSVFTQATRYRAAAIARTEASRAVHAGALATYRRSGVVAGIEWLISSDACPLCRQIAAEARRVRLGERFATIGDHPDYATIRHPPAHVRCRCSVVAVLKSEYGGPEHVDWAAPLDQPAPGAEYRPPEGLHVPRPDPGRKRGEAT